MAYIRYESEPGESTEMEDVSIDYDAKLDAFVFDVPVSEEGRERAIPREKVYSIEYDPDEKNIA